MILDKKIKVKIDKKNIIYYSQFFENLNLKDIIELDPNNLQKGSNKKVNVKCEICGEERYIKYQAYLTNVNSCQKYKIYTCDKCSHLKIKETNRLKYGVDYFSKTDGFSEKIKKTSIEKFGVDHYSKTEEYLSRRSQTNLERYGIDNPFKDIEKIKKSYQEKLGVINPMQLDYVKEKAVISQRQSFEKSGKWIPLSMISDFKIYKNKVRSITRKNYKSLLESWDGYDFYDGEYIKNNFQLHYFDNKYPTIDHKISIYDGFISGISPVEISNIKNLCFTKRITNIIKNKNSIHYD